MSEPPGIDCRILRLLADGTPVVDVNDAERALTVAGVCVPVPPPAGYAPLIDRLSTPIDGCAVSRWETPSRKAPASSISHGGTSPATSGWTSRKRCLRKASPGSALAHSGSVRNISDTNVEPASSGLGSGRSTTRFLGRPSPRMSRCAAPTDEPRAWPRSPGLVSRDSIGITWRCCRAAS